MNDAHSTPGSRLKLNLIDRGFLGSRPIMGIFHFRDPLEPQRVYDGIRTVLAVNPLVSTRIIEDDAGVQWLEHEPDYFSFRAHERRDVDAIRLLGAEESPFHRLGEMIDDIPTALNQPLLAVRLTQVQSGTVLSMAVSHACADAEAGRLFMVSLMVAMMGHSPPRPSQQRSFGFQRSGERDAPTLELRPYQEHEIVCTHPPRPGVIRNVRLSSEMIASELDALTGSPCTAHDVIAAWVVKHESKRMLPGKQNVNIRIPVSIRELITGLDLSYMGNAYIDCFLTWPARELERLSIQDIAVAVRGAVTSAKDPAFLNSRIKIDEHGLNYDGFIDDNTQGFDPENDLIISSIGNFQSNIGGPHAPDAMLAVPAVPICTMVHRDGSEDYLLRNFSPSEDRGHGVDVGRSRPRR